MDIPVEETRSRARVTEHHIENTAYTKYPGNYYGKSDEWNLAEFEANFKAEVIEYHKGRDLELDLIGIAPAIANAYRRIMIAEVPTIAIEHCFIYNNTSVIQDEMLAHRFGMLPIRVDPSSLNWKDPAHPPENVGPKYSLVFTLEAKCEKLPDKDSDKTGRREELYKDYKVYSGQIKWKPLGKQAVSYDKMPPRTVHKKVLIAKLSGKQEIEVKLHANKGIGRDHAKFSPVATASYRLMPDIRLLTKIAGDEALKLKESFSEGVVEINRHGEAKIVNPRIDTGSRNVFRHTELKDKVVYDLIKDHYIFKVESTGCMPALDILLQSCEILESKCKYFLDQLQICRARVDESASMVEDI